LGSKLLHAAPGVTIRDATYGFRIAADGLADTDVFPSVTYLNLDNCCISRSK